MSVKEARRHAKEYLAKLIPDIEAKLKTQQQKNHADKEHKDLQKYIQLCEEQSVLIETLRSQLEAKTEEADELRLKL